MRRKKRPRIACGEHATRFPLPSPISVNSVTTGAWRAGYEGRQRAARGAGGRPGTYHLLNYTPGTNRQRGKSIYLEGGPIN
eukprot:329780-Pyramimonas_sp.AAC.1